MEEKYVLERHKINYIYPDGTKAFIDIKNSDDCLIRYQTINSKTKELPFNGEYYGVDPDIFFNYLENKATINDVIEDFQKRHYIRHDIQF